MNTDHLRAPLHVLPDESGCVIDCDTCTVRGAACDDCVVSVMLGGPPDVVAPEEQRALSVLSAAGLVPPLLMTPPPAADPGPAGAPVPTPAPALAPAPDAAPPVVAAPPARPTDAPPATAEGAPAPPPAPRTPAG